MRKLSLLLFLFFSFQALSLEENSYLDRADSCLNLSNFEDAIIYYKSALNSMDKESYEQRCELYLKLGHSYKVLEKYDDAFLVLERALFLVKKIDNIDLLLRTKIGYAELMRSINECEKAIEILESTTVKSNLSKIDLTTQAEYYDRYAAIVNQCEGDLKRSMEYSQKALVLARKSKSPHHIATSLNELGYILEHSKSPKEALSYYKEALMLWKNKKHRRYAPNACLNLSRCYSKIGDLDSSLYYADKGLTIVGDDDWFNMLVPLYSAKLSYLEQMERWKEAYEVRWLYHLAAINMRSQEWSDKMATVKGELDLEKKESELATERSKNNKAENTIEHEGNIRRLLIFIIAAVSFLILVVIYFFVKLKRLNSKLKDTLSENDILLKEVHHRVKNNMQVVSSLLDLQSSFTIDENSKAALINSRDRINSMALAHQNLYVENDLKSINVKNYLQVLIQSIVSKDIVVEQEIDDSQMEIEKAQALGFVLNELLTNSLKHAWNNGNSDKLIWIKLKRGDKDWSFSYSDNGVGVKDKAKFLESPTFGVTLIRSFLKRNLKVNMIFGEKPGMNIEFTFKQFLYESSNSRR